MSNYINLVGAEEVQRAANTISSAASDMRQAASNLQCAVDDQRRILDDFMIQFRDVVESLSEAINNSNLAKEEEDLHMCDICQGKFPRDKLTYYEGTSVLVCVEGDCYGEMSKVYKED